LAKKLERRRSQLQTKIDAFLDKTPMALGNVSCEDQSPIPGQHLDQDYYADEDGVEDYNQHHDGDSDIDEDEDEDDYEEEINMMDHHHIKPTGTHCVPERICLPLPSHLGPTKDQDQTIAALIKEELIIRESQASEALQHLRLSLGMKSAIYRKVVSNAKSQQKKTRAWRAVGVASATVQQHAQTYCLARHALVQLHAHNTILKRFPPLHKGDLRVSRDVVEENRIGQRSEHVSWIWRMDIGQDDKKNEWMHESESHILMGLQDCDCQFS
jgi:hypothetical protein